MSRIDQSRRRFLRAVGLGAGARVLAPIATLLHSRAFGQAPSTKKVVFISLGAGLPDLQLGTALRTSETQWSYHEALAPLAPWKAKTAIVTGLGFEIPGMQHSAGYGLLAATRTQGVAQDLGAPTAATIDQLLGAKLSSTATIPTLLFGIDREQSRHVHQSLFAAGPNQPVPYPVRASVLFERLFPNSAGAQSSTADSARVMSRLRNDITRLKTKLAGEERVKLDRYLEALDSYDRRRATSTCSTSMASAGTERGVVAELPAMFDMAATALQCGMTNVVGCAIGGGNSHYHFPLFVGPHRGTRFEDRGYVADFGHDAYADYSDGRTIVWRWLSEQIAIFLRRLEAPSPDGHRLIDSTTVVLFSDSGPDHHNGNSWRFVVIGDAAGGLKTGGRFLTYPPDTSWTAVAPGSRTVNSFLSALSTGLGVPLSSFGTVLPGRSSAPLADLLPG